MARTKKQTRPSGYEYWGTRHGKKHGVEPGPFTKKVTHRRERKAGKIEARKEGD